MAKKSLFDRALSAAGPSSRLADIEKLRTELEDAAVESPAAGVRALYRAMGSALDVREAEIDAYYRLRREMYPEHSSDQFT